MHHADPSGVSQPSRFGMMLECSNGKLLARAAFMHHDDQGHDALRHDAVFKGVTHLYTADVSACIIDQSLAL